MDQAGPFNRVKSVSPPLKGSFPLDHDRKCKLEMLKYMCCLHEKKQHNSECRDLAREYFKCRMDNGLMDKDEWETLGYRDITKA
ncbi:unnamed protein product, partial [Mesorhabditis belari]|uniref:Cytochrome c oxidase assembly protein COX19 n=1 Tax=Mesorhabditis belari TaxID=2138241 RepID=A0AAF3FDV5_9BILA